MLSTRPISIAPRSSCKGENEEPTTSLRNHIFPFVCFLFSSNTTCSMLLVIFIDNNFVDGTRGFFQSQLLEARAAESVGEVEGVPHFRHKGLEVGVGLPFLGYAELPVLDEDLDVLDLVARTDSRDSISQGFRQTEPDQIISFGLAFKACLSLLCLQVTPEATDTK